MRKCACHVTIATVGRQPNHSSNRLCAAGATGGIDNGVARSRGQTLNDAFPSQGITILSGSIPAKIIASMALTDSSPMSHVISCVDARCAMVTSFVAHSKSLILPTSFHFSSMHVPVLSATCTSGVTSETIGTDFGSFVLGFCTNELADESTRLDFCTGALVGEINRTRLLHK
jgi:hypothetical protein